MVIGDKKCIEYKKINEKDPGAASGEDHQMCAVCLVGLERSYPLWVATAWSNNKLYTLLSSTEEIKTSNRKKRNGADQQKLNRLSPSTL